MSLHSEIFLWICPAKAALSFPAVIHASVQSYRFQNNRFQLFFFFDSSPPFWFMGNYHSSFLQRFPFESAERLTDNKAVTFTTPEAGKSYNYLFCRSGCALGLCSLAQEHLWNKVKTQAWSPGLTPLLQPHGFPWGTSFRCPPGWLVTFLNCNDMNSSFSSSVSICFNYMTMTRFRCRLHLALECSVALAMLSKSLSL